jgi:hypothetical protein
MKISYISKASLESLKMDILNDKIKKFKRDYKNLITISLKKNGTSIRIMSRSI